MAVQTLPVIVWMIEFDGLLRLAYVLRINMVQPSQFGIKAAENRVIGMAGVTGFIARHASILEMRGRNIRRIVHIQAMPVRLHDVAAQAK